ncbi:MAG: NRDE family protein [Steroidobacteraceae bacterium]
MCLILVAWRTHPKYPCIIAANRDEFFERPTEAAHWWSDAAQILAGRDLMAGGTWLGVTRAGRFAALTNYRAPQQKHTDAPSRGLLVTRMLKSVGSVEEDLAQLQRVGAAYNDFNLIFSDGEQLGVYESVSGARLTLSPGIYGLSNHLLDTPWPKVQKAKSRLQAALGNLDDPIAVLELLRDDRPALDDELPRTGVSLEWERLLSSAFVCGTGYGTRSSTVIRIDQHGTVFFDEWSWGPSGSQSGKKSFQFEISAC